MEAGPEIPPHILAKRKRKAEEAAAAAAAAAIGPTNSEQSEGDKTTAEKRPRVIGPAPPPASLDERPNNIPTGEEEEESSDDDEIGPALPSGLAPEEEEIAARQRLARYEQSRSEGNESDGKLHRDEWMIVPPKDSDWTTRVDPTKIRARKFQSGKGAKAPNRSGGDMTLWTETPAEKQKRLNDEVLGLRNPATEASNDQPTGNSAEAEETARRIREYNEKHRSSTLYDQHSKKDDKKVEDDPSKRAWDKEKDFALGRKVTHAQRKELLNRASQFGDRFSSGNFL